MSFVLKLREKVPEGRGMMIRGRSQRMYVEGHLRRTKSHRMEDVFYSPWQK